MKKIIISLILCGVLFVQSSNVSAAVGIHYSMYGASNRKPMTSVISVYRKQGQKINVNVSVRWNYFYDVKHKKTYTKGSCSNLYVQVLYSNGKVHSQAELPKVLRGGNSKYRYKSYKKIKIKKNDNYKIRLKAKCINSVFDGYGTLTY